MMFHSLFTSFVFFLLSISMNHHQGANTGVAAESIRATTSTASDVQPHERQLDHKSDPYLNANFQVFIEGVVDHDSSFELVSGLESETEVEEYKDGNELLIHKMPGLTHYNNIILKRRFRGDDQDDGMALWAWYQGGANGDFEPRDGHIAVLDKYYETPLMYFHFYDAFPVRYHTFTLAGGKKDDDRILMEEIELAVEKMVLGSPGV